MKKAISIFLTCLVLISSLCLLSACSVGNMSEADKEENLLDMVDGTLSIMTEVVNEYPQEAAEATAEDKADLQKQGEEMIQSLDDLKAEIADNLKEVPQEEADSINQRIDEMKATIQQGLDTLATK